MHFFVDDAEAFARRCRAELLETRQFFTEFRKVLARRASIGSRLAMALVERTKRLRIIWLRFPAS